MIHDIIISSSSLLDTSLSEGMFVVYFVIFAIAFIAILISSIVTAVRRIKRNKRRDRRPPPQHYYNGSPGSGSRDFFDTPPGVGTHNIDPFELGGHDEPASYGGSPGVSDGNAYANTQDVSPDGAHCPASGAQIERNEKFCPYCGHKFR